MMVYKKTKDMKVTDMCIYVDSKIKYLACTEEPDLEIVETVYRYLYLIIYALSMAAGYFRDSQDYNDFAVSTASILYMRIADKRQYLPDGDPKKITPIVSILNYLNTALPGLKVNYQQENFSMAMHPKYASMGVTGFSAKEYVESLEIATMRSYIEDEFDTIPRIIKKIINTTPYRNDEVVSKNLYISLVLSFLDMITLPNVYLNRSKVKTNLDDTKLIKIYLAQQNNYPILYHIDSDLADYVRVLLARVKKAFVNKVFDVKSLFTVSDDIIKSMVASIYTENTTGGSDDDY